MLRRCLQDRTAAGISHTKLIMGVSTSTTQEQPHAKSSMQIDSQAWPLEECKGGLSWASHVQICRFRAPTNEEEVDNDGHHKHCSMHLTSVSLVSIVALHAQSRMFCATSRGRLHGLH